MRSILIKNGRIWNGTEFFYGDVFADGGRIVEISENIDREAYFTYNAEGKTVSSGFVDIHVHMQGISPDIYGIQTEMSCLPFGVTSAADAGACFGDEGRLEQFAVKSYAYAFAEVENNSVSLEKIESKLKQYGSRALGIKISFDTNGGQVKDIGVLQELCAIARDKKLPVVVHTSNSPVSMLKIAETLSRGDIITHAFHGGLNSSDENGYEALSLAREKGIVVDAGLAGYVHTDFGVFKGAVEAGYSPDVISTDITCASAYMRGGRYGMTMCMSVAREVGMSEEDIFRAVTSTPSRVIGIPSGKLAVGETSDIAVVEYGNDPFELTDARGNTVKNTKAYKCVLTVSDGTVVYRA